MNDVDDGRTELPGLDVTRECINTADKQEATRNRECGVQGVGHAGDQKGVAESPAAGC